MIICAALTLCVLLAGCGAAEKTEDNMYISITPQQAKELMDSESGYVILDVREADEYAQGHIPGAVLIPHTQITLRAESELPDKEQLILVYCRSGRRSKLAAQDLAELGYSNIREFGGIIDWPYEISE